MSALFNRDPAIKTSFNDLQYLILADFARLILPNERHREIPDIVQNFLEYIPGKVERTMPLSSPSRNVSKLVIDSIKANAEANSRAPKTTETVEKIWNLPSTNKSSRRQKIPFRAWNLIPESERRSMCSINIKSESDKGESMCGAFPLVQPPNGNSTMCTTCNRKFKAELDKAATSKGTVVTKTINDGVSVAANAKQTDLSQVQVAPNMIKTNIEGVYMLNMALLNDVLFRKTSKGQYEAFAVTTEVKASVDGEIVVLSDNWERETKSSLSSFKINRIKSTPGLVIPE